MRKLMAVTAVLLAGSAAMAETISWNFNDATTQGWRLTENPAGNRWAAPGERTNSLDGSLALLFYGDGWGSSIAGVVDLPADTGTQAGATLSMDIVNGVANGGSGGRVDKLYIDVIGTDGKVYTYDNPALYDRDGVNAGTYPEFWQWQHISINLADLGIARGTGLSQIRVRSAQLSWMSPSDFSIDNVVLANVPEPMSLAVLVMGGLGLLRRKN